MPLPGGAADKLGNRYEGRWTVFCMIDVMDEKADSIQLEKAGEDAFEFFLKKDGKQSCHQVKRQKGGRAGWTINLMAEVLTNFWDTLQDPRKTCTFVSMQNSEQVRELSKRARDSASWLEFNQQFLKKTHSQNFHLLRQKWSNCSEEQAYEILQRIYIETIEDDLLANFVETRLETLVEGDPKLVRLDLAELVVDKIHQELTAYDIWHYLVNERGYRRREWGKDPHVLAAVEQANKHYLSTLLDADINGKVLPRDEVPKILEKLTGSHNHKGVLLVGEAGVGKSGVTRQVVESLEQEGIPLIAFRVDRLEPNHLPDKVGEQSLGLPASPITVLANIVQKRDCVIVIDQLDAVSLASGRNPDFFDCIASMIRQAEAYSNIRLLLVCRKFDLDNDERIRRLTGHNGIVKTVTVNRLSTQTVKEIVAEVGLNITRLTEKQLKLLSIPLHLKLLADIAPSLKTNTLNISTAKELYDQFWEYKQHKIKERLNRTVQWTKVIDLLCQYMSDRQSLSIAEDYLDDYRDDVEIMASEHILIWENKRVSFFHESFFDYSFARRFLIHGQTLPDFLRSGEQHLFCRAQVRQILLHERDNDFDQYLSDFETLLTSSDIRYHLKRVVFSMPQTLDNPTQEEWDILTSLITEHPLLNMRTGALLRNSSRWFELVDSLGLVEQWLEFSQEMVVDKTLFLLSLMQKYFPDRVAEIIEPFVGKSTTWTKRFFTVLSSAELHTGRRFFELFLRMIQTGVLEQAETVSTSRQGFWEIIHDLSEKEPEWACEAIGCYLEWCLDLAISRGQTNPFDHDSPTVSTNYYSEDELSTSANLAPRSFVHYILPFMLRVIQLNARLNARQDSGPPFLDAVWWARTCGDDYEIEHKLLKSMEMALAKIAMSHPNHFTEITRQYFANSDFETIQYLLIRAYTANGNLFADESINYLLERPIRLQTGYVISNSDYGEYWATYLLLEAITPYSTEDNLRKLELLILSYYPDFEKSPEGRYARGYLQFVLLKAIDCNRTSHAVKRRLQELERKFTAERWLKAPTKFEPPKSIEARFVEPAVPQSAADKMTDKQWLQVINEYHHENAGDWFEKNGKLAGGAPQISRELLEPQVKKEPLRFAELIHAFPDTASLYYFRAVLRGISHVGVDLETASKVYLRCHSLPSSPCGREINWLVQELAQLPWDQKILEIVAWYALNDPDPAQELWREEAQDDQTYIGRAVMSDGANCVRDSAALAISRLIFSDKNRAAYFIPTLEKMVKDPSIAVLSCVASALTALLNYDRDIAVSLFLKLIDTEDVLLSTQTVERFIFYVLPSHFEQLKPILTRMLSSDLAPVVKVGARQACFASLNLEAAASFANNCLSGTKEQRLAAAEVFVARLHSAYFRERCETFLIQLFHDLDQDVRAKASRCFFNFEDKIAEFPNLIAKFIESPAFTENSDGLIWSLEKTSAKLPELTYLICEQFVQSLITDESTSDRMFHSDASSVSKILVRLYSQSNRNPELQSQCLDLIDLMAELEVYDLDRALSSYER